MNSSANIPLADAPLANQTFCNHRGFTVEVCRDQASLNTAFDLRYRAYISVGAVEPNEAGLLYDDYDFLPNAYTHLVWHEGKPVATVRGCIYSAHYDWQLTEGICYFKDDVKSHLGEQSPLLESNRYVIDPEFQGRQSLYAQLLMFRTHAFNSIAHQCDHIITSVRSNHAAFYARYLGMTPLTENVRHIEWVHSDVQLLTNTVEESLACALRRGMPDFTPEEIARYAECAGLTDYMANIAA